VAVTALRTFWFKPPPAPCTPFGIGVTARSLDDALAIIRALDYGGDWPDEVAGWQVIEGITVAELDPRHVVPNMGPIAVRGMWYPFVAVGVPRWAEERINSRR
jgi:hypothetical protein